MASSRVAGARLDSLWQQAREPVFVLNPEGKLVWVNPAWVELTGYPADQVLGLSCQPHGLAAAGTPAALAASFRPPREVDAGQPASAPALIVHATGERRWRRVEFWPFHGAGDAPLAVLGIVRSPDAPPAVADAVSERLRHDLLDVKSRLLARHGSDALVGDGPNHRRLLEQVRAAAVTRVHVLVVGEPGTGKRTVARAIHHAGPAPDAPFSPFDCEALPAAELERELFNGRAGACGTLLLCNIGYLARDLQARLAAALDQPFRLIATTALDPDDALRTERLHPDLFFGITAFVIALPPLRERAGEIPLLAQHFLDSANERAGGRRRALAPDAVRVLQEYDWPGNLRELARVVDGARERAQGDFIDADDLPAAVRGHLGAAYNPPPRSPALPPLDELLTQVERRLIEYALNRARQNKSKAADILGISRPRLYRRIKELGLPHEPEPADEAVAADAARP